MLHVLYAYEAVANQLNPFQDRMEHCATWSCDCGASGEGDPRGRVVLLQLPGEVEPC